MTKNKTEVDAGYVREWARKRGLRVGLRGHLPQEVIDAFNKAHRTKHFSTKNPSTLKLLANA